MKTTGIVRNLDDLGQVVIPQETRRMLDIKVKDQIEIYVDGDSIILKKYSAGCFFCGSDMNGFIFNGKHVCLTCLGDLKNIDLACM